MDLSKTYVCLPLQSLVAKFEAYGIDKAGLFKFNTQLLIKP